MIYFIRARLSGNYKIGYTSHAPERRLPTLQTGCYEPLELVGSIPGEMDVEKSLHARFAAHRLHGEWFAPAEEVAEGIQSLLTPHPPHGSAQPGSLNVRVWRIDGETAGESGSGGCTLVCLLYAFMPPHPQVMLDAVTPGQTWYMISAIRDVSESEAEWGVGRGMVVETLAKNQCGPWVIDLGGVLPFQHINSPRHLDVTISGPRVPTPEGPKACPVCEGDGLVCGSCLAARGFCCCDRRSRNYRECWDCGGSGRVPEVKPC